MGKKVLCCWRVIQLTHHTTCASLPPCPSLDGPPSPAAPSQRAGATPTPKIYSGLPLHRGRRRYRHPAMAPSTSAGCARVAGARALLQGQPLARQLPQRRPPLLLPRLRSDGQLPPRRSPRRRLLLHRPVFRQDTDTGTYTLQHTHTSLPSLPTPPRHPPTSSAPSGSSPQSSTPQTRSSTSSAGSRQHQRGGEQRPLQLQSGSRSLPSCMHSGAY